MFNQPKVKDKDARHHEKVLLGGMLYDPSQVAAVVLQIKPAFFRITKHRLIYDAIRALHKSGTPVNVLNLANAMTVKHSISITGGVKYLAELVAYAEKAAKAHHAGAIRAGIVQAGGKV